MIFLNFPLNCSMIYTLQAIVIAAGYVAQTIKISQDLTLCKEQKEVMLRQASQDVILAFDKLTKESVKESEAVQAFIKELECLKQKS